MTAPTSRDVARLLPRAMVRLRARLRTESAPVDQRWTWPQVTTLSRVADDEPTTVAALAAAEHVRPQSMAETVATLFREGLVTRSADPTDGRKTLVSISAAGRDLLTSIPAVREAWLEAAVERHLSPAERQTLAEAAKLMERLADS